jgi:hypothetical protein
MLNVVQMSSVVGGQASGENMGMYNLADRYPLVARSSGGGEIQAGA